MSRTLIKGAEAALPTSSGAASNFSSATSVRLVNTSASTDHLVTVVETQGGSTVGSFTLLKGTTEILEKQSSHFVFAANADVKGAKVGFTG